MINYAINFVLIWSSCIYVKMNIYVLILDTASTVLTLIYSTDHIIIQNYTFKYNIFIQLPNFIIIVSYLVSY
jgi:hypothetical protein